MSTELTTQNGGGITSPRSLSEMTEMVSAVQKALGEFMKEGVDYGKIPGTDKPTLLKPGAEKLCMLFRLSPKFNTQIKYLENGHIGINCECTLIHIPTGQIWASANAMASTLESKHRFRNAAKKCPKCGSEAIIKGKAEYGGGWLCFAKKGGCGAKYRDGAHEIESQPAGQIENPNPADQWNPSTKMAEIRAYRAAVLYATAASAVFTQDIEEIEENRVAAQKAAAKEKKWQLTPSQQSQLSSQGELIKNHGWDFSVEKNKLLKTISAGENPQEILDEIDEKIQECLDAIQKRKAQEVEAENELE